MRNDEEKQEEEEAENVFCDLLMKEWMDIMEKTGIKWQICSISFVWIDNRLALKMLLLFFLCALVVFDKFV